MRAVPRSFAVTTAIVVGLAACFVASPRAQGEPSGKPASSAEPPHASKPPTAASSASAPDASVQAAPAPKAREENEPTPPTSHASGSKSSKITIAGPDGKTVVCREQSAQPFLVRGNWFPTSKDADVLKQGRKMLEQAIRYRTEHYGYFEGFGNASWNKHPPKFYAKPTTFMGLSLRVHERVIPALKCVEAALQASPAGAEYKPQTAGGIRFKNTYRGVEVSNHVYGIAVDIEPDRNSCCGCVAPWPNHPLCKAKDKTVWERMAMPKSWVDTFERYGFYWLGHDTLRDTMHFEFLGDPNKIYEGQESGSTSP